MLRRWSGLAVGFVVLALLTPGLVEAQKKEEPKSTEETEAINEVDLSDLGTAFQLIEYGREHKAPEALIAAAGLLRNVGRAKLTELEIKPEVQDAKGNAVKEGLKSAAVSKLNLTNEADSLDVEATGMAAKQKLNLLALVGAVKKRELKGDAGNVKCCAGSLDGGRQLVFRFKVGNDQATTLTIRSTEALRISVVRNDDKSTLAAALTTGGNVVFQPKKGGEMTRGVRLSIKESIKETIRVGKTKPKAKPTPHTKRRAIGDGDCEVTLRIENSSSEAADFTLFLK